MSWLPTLFLALLTFSLLLRYWGFPLLFRSLTQFRVSSFSLLSARGIEWRSPDQPSSVVPTLRLERARWAWGGVLGEAVGLIVLRLEGISFRVKRRKKEKGVETPRPSGRMSVAKGKLISNVLHLMIHHYPALARLISIQVSDIRLIFDDLDGLEVTINDFRFGVKVNFEGSSDAAPPSPIQPSSFTMSPCPMQERGFPLPSDDDRSPPPSPTQSVSFRQPFTGEEITSSPVISDPMEEKASRLSQARRRATIHYAKMTTTAGTVWSRAIGRAHGSVSFTAMILDGAVILPHESAPPPVSARPSIHDLNKVPTPRSSIRMEAPKPRTFSSAHSLHAIFRRGPQYAAPSPEAGAEKLLSLGGTSKVVFGLGFGPKKGLLAEDTLRSEVELGRLQTSLGAAERLQELVKSRKTEVHKEEKEEKKPRQLWGPRAMPRIILRAFECVSFSFADISLSHMVPRVDPVPQSASSSFIDLDSLSTEDAFIVSLHLKDLSCRLSAADSSNNDRARNAFGTNFSPASRVRGAGFGLQWSAIELQCVAPGEKAEERSQLVSIRDGDFEGLSTWRPAGWSREELLFANDPNLALVVGKGSIASVNISGDVQLLGELSEGWKRSRPHLPPKPPRTDPISGLPPRFRMVLDVGHAMVILADRISTQQTTLTLESAGLHLGCFTGFSEIIARRRDRATNKAAFKEEEELQARRAEAGSEADFALPASMLKPQHRRKNVTPAELHDDFSISMRADASLALEPMALHLTLSELGTGEQKTYHVASIGRMHGNVTGDVLARQECTENGIEVATLDPTSLSCNVDVGLDQGVKVDLWNMAVVKALVAMGEAHRSSASSTRDSSSQPDALLSRLPSGISARVSLGLVSVFVGHEDPNPFCKLRLTRGLWVQSRATVEYAYYQNRAQAMTSRHALTAATRAKLKLPDDITTQALAFFNHHAEKQGQAALVSFNLAETFVKPIFHGERFVAAGGTSLSHQTPQMPKQRKNDDYVGWEFRRPLPEMSNKSGDFANNVPPLEISDTDQARRPLIRIPYVVLNWLIQRPQPGVAIEHKLSAKVEHTAIVCDLSHIYTALLAALTIRQVVAASKRPKVASEAKPPLNLSAQVSIPCVTAHFAFPLKEQAVLYFNATTVSMPSGEGITAGMEQALMYVPSAREIGTWEELARIKRLGVKTAPPGAPKAFDIDAEAMRIRIPVAYTMSKLILNINVSVKALKLLTQDLGGEEFSLVKRPSAEAPKHVPTLNFSIKHMSLEAKDNPIETNLNLIWRAGMVEQEKRNDLEDRFAQKMALLNASDDSDESLQNGNGHANGHGRHSPKLTRKAAVSADEARYRLDWWFSRSWTKRIRNAKREQQRREMAALRHFQNSGADIKLPITIASSTQTAPLFRAALGGVKFAVSDPGMSRDEIVQYMGEVSAPFDEGVEFSLMVPLKLVGTMESAHCALRDYPLPLIKIPPVEKGETRPAWHVETPFIIAEELQNDDSTVFVPCDVLPKGCGAAASCAFTVQIAKTIMPVKTYARPIVKVAAARTTEFTWGNSYQPAIQDFTKVIESLSHPPRDSSPRVGFWDKFRLILHWKVTMEFVGPVHLHLKGSYDPYSVSGHGCGFALSWRHDTRVTIGHPNPQYETIQIESRELLVAIPDLTALHDGAAIGTEAAPHPPKAAERDNNEQNLIQRRYTKPCARFQNGIRVGFGFKFERTCRSWNCEQDCGQTENLFHRQCRFFDFAPHQAVILRSPEAVERDEQRVGHTVDSYEGFRSDYIHFSVSLVAGLGQKKGGQLLRLSENADEQSSLHFSPKAFAEFFAWWRSFNHNLSLPIRQGKLFPNSPPSSKKFGRSLGTIKYRFDLAPVYLSHVYTQVAPELWAAGKSRSLGVKARFGRFRADAHQRAQEKVVRHDKLHRTTVVMHKPFYAADIILENTVVKGIQADFVERKMPDADEADYGRKASELEPNMKSWYNFFDFIDADRKPFDRDPVFEVVELGDCPQVHFSKRNKARQTTPHDDDNSSLGSGSDSRIDVESSKFGHEKSHICYLGVAPGVGPTQLQITKERIDELEERLRSIPVFGEGYGQADRGATEKKLKTLYKHQDELISKEKRHVDDATLQDSHNHGQADPEQPFEHTFHVHNPRVHWSNAARNILYKYYFSSRDRKKEEYTTSHASLRWIRDGIQRRLQMMQAEWAGEVMPESHTPNEDAAQDMLQRLERSLQGKDPAKRFQLPVYHSADHEDLRKPSCGLPSDAMVKPKDRFLVLKPQIALRSEVDENSIVLLTVEEISFKGFQIIDELGTDTVTSEILTRNYVSMKGMQAFYPTEETMQRKRGTTGIPRGLDFIPLEIFLDVRSEATDYDRIVLKTDAALSFDKFNNLRTPRGLEWPELQEDNFEEISHLRVHQDLTTIIVPRLTVSATSRHYTALYNVVTDLLMYQDPQHRHRNERVDSFMFAFDRKDRDPGRLLLDLFHLQSSIRSLASLQRGYETNADLLTEEGRGELLKIRADLLEATEQLFTIFDAIAVNWKRDDARAALITSTRMDVRVGGVAWHMLREDLRPLVKLDIDGMLYSYLTNKDGSNDSALAISDLAALNSEAGALYPEVVTRHNSASSAKRKIKDSFASASWSILAPVGGIPIVRHFGFSLHPVRCQIEEWVGHEVADYVFSGRRKSKAEANGHGHGGSGGSGGNAALLNGLAPPQNGHDNGNRNGNGVDNGMPALSRTKSTASVTSQATNNRAAGHDEKERGKPDAKFTMVPSQDAAEMRRRASANKTFVRVVFGATSLLLSYKTDDKKKHSTFSLPDCVDFKVKTPEMVYVNKVWGYEDIFEHVKRDIRSFAWSQTGDIVSQVFKNTSIFRSKKGLKRLAIAQSEAFKPKMSSPSRLRYPVDAPSLMDEENEAALVRALSRHSTRLSEGTSASADSSPVARVISRGRDLITPSSVSGSGSGSMSIGSGSGSGVGSESRIARLREEEESDYEPEQDKSLGVGSAVKGLLGKFRPRRGDGVEGVGGR